MPAISWVGSSGGILTTAASTAWACLIAATGMEGRLGGGGGAFAGDDSGDGAGSTLGGGGVGFSIEVGGVGFSIEVFGAGLAAGVPPSP